jgi:ABC-type Fe3+/spermidine/putrescine transport system ATPase subunit
MMTQLTLSHLTKQYPNGVQAVADFSLTVASGELLALLGPSGCGKSTLLRMIAGLLAPTRGDIAFNGQSVLRAPAQKRGAVMVFQQHQLFPFMSVADNIAFGLKIQKFDRATISQKISQILDMVQLPGYQERMPDQLSGGERQRIALARALVLKPNLLLLDEPLSHLNPGLREELREMICHLQKQTGITTLFVTHDQTEAVAIANRVALMVEGQLKQIDTPRAFFERPADRDVAEFFGGVNFLPAQKRGNVLETELGRLEIDPSLPDGQAIATIRPEAIELGPNGHNNLKVRIKTYNYHGMMARCLTGLGHVDLQFITPPHQQFQVGQEIIIHIPRDRIWLLPNA